MALSKSNRSPGSLITVIPVYNGEAYLKATLESVASQTRPPDRLVILDDGSTDQTEDIVRSFKDIPCEWHPNPENVGLFPNLNQALSWAKQADYFHLLLADDLIAPDFLEVSEQLLLDQKKGTFTWCDTQWIDTHGSPVGEPVPDTQSAGYTFCKKRFLQRESELQTISVGSFLIKSGYESIGCDFRTDMPQVADCVFFGELASRAPKILHLPRPLCQIRTHATNMTHHNIHNLSAWVTDEWVAMQSISQLMEEPFWCRWLREQKLRCLYAARCCVKEQWMKPENADYAQKIRRASRETVGCLHDFLGRAVVSVRDRFKGPTLPRS